jgi:hypothetical protein
MLGSEPLSVSVQAGAILAPVAGYFLLLGLLNSRPHPQVVSGRTDFVVLNAAIFPIFVVPVLNWLGASFWTLLAVLGAMVAAAGLLAPPPSGNWVVYNVSLPEAMRAVQRALDLLGQPFRRQGRSLVLTRLDVTVRLNGLPLLRNVCLSAQGGDLKAFAKDFEAALGRQLAAIPTVAAPMAVAFLLIAIGMMLAPLGLLANRMPEMVRILTDLVR